MFTKTLRLAIVAALVPISIALSAAPGQAQVVTTGSVAVTGIATCNTPTGHPTWTINWTIDNTIGIANPGGPPSPQTIRITAADETGLVAADILASVNPALMPPNSTATASDGPIPNAIGDVTLTVAWQGESQSGTAPGTVHLDGTCLVAATTTTAAPTTTAPAAAAPAVAAKPAFTG